MWMPRPFLFEMSFFWIFLLLSLMFTVSFETTSANAEHDINSLEAPVNKYYDENAVEQLQHREKRLASLVWTIGWSILFTPLATMTVSKNFDAIAELKKCWRKGKQHFERETELMPRLFKSVFCRETEIEAKEKEMLIDIVKIGFDTMTDQTRALVGAEYAIFQNKTDELRKTGLIEHMTWNAPSKKGKRFLCLLRAYGMLDDLKAETDSAEKKIWERCAKMMEARHQESWRTKMGHEMKSSRVLWEKNFACLWSKVDGWLRRLRQPFDGLTSAFGRWNKKDEEVIQQANNSEKLELEKELESPKCNAEKGKGIFELVEKKWPKEMDKHFAELLEAEFRMEKDAKTNQYLQTPALFTNRIVVDSGGVISINFEDQKYPDYIQRIIENALVEGLKTLELMGVELEVEHRKRFLVIEFRNAVRIFVDALIQGGEQPAEDRVLRMGESVREKYRHLCNGEFHSWTKADMNWLFDANQMLIAELHDLYDVNTELNTSDRVYTFVPILKIQRDSAYSRDTVVTALEEWRRQRTSTADAIMMNKPSEQPQKARRKKRQNAVLVLLFGISMQQGYRHFNLIQLVRDCFVRSLNYKRFACSPPKMIQEEIAFVQKAREIAFEELTVGAIDQIRRRFNAHKEFLMHRRDAIVPIQIARLKGKLGKDQGVEVPILFLRELDAKERKLRVPIATELLREMMRTSHEKLPEDCLVLKDLAEIVDVKAHLEAPAEHFRNYKNDAHMRGKEAQLKRPKVPMAVSGAFFKQRFERGDPTRVPQEYIAQVIPDGKKIDASLDYVLAHTPKEMETLRIALGVLETVVGGEREEAKLHIKLLLDLFPREEETLLSVPISLVALWMGRTHFAPANPVEIALDQLNGHLKPDELVPVSGIHFDQDFRKFHANEDTAHVAVPLLNCYIVMLRSAQEAARKGQNQGKNNLFGLFNFQSDEKVVPDLQNLKAEDLPQLGEFVSIPWKSLKAEQQKHQAQFPKKLRVSMQWLAARFKSHEEANERVDVPITLLEETMTSVETLPVPSEFLAEKGLKIPHRYAYYLDCQSGYQYEGAEINKRCELMDNFYAKREEKGAAKSEVNLNEGKRKEEVAVVSINGQRAVRKQTEVSKWKRAKQSSADLLAKKQTAKWTNRLVQMGESEKQELLGQAHRQVSAPAA